MGITIHFRLRLREDNALHGLLRAVEQYASARKWPTRAITESDVVLQRSSNIGDWEYQGPSAGIEVLPDEFCDPVRLEFGSDSMAFDFTKTQFAGPSVHREVVELLDSLRPYLADVEVEDEGEYWESRDVKLLEYNIATCQEKIREAMAARPNSHGPIRLPSGRWADIISQVP